MLVETKLLNLLIRNLEQRTGRLLLKRDRLMARLERLQRKREAKWLKRFSRRGIVYLHAPFVSEPLNDVESAVKWRDLNDRLNAEQVVEACNYDDIGVVRYHVVLRRVAVNAMKCLETAAMSPDCSFRLFSYLAMWWSEQVDLAEVIPYWIAGFEGLKWPQANGDDDEDDESVWLRDRSVIDLRDDKNDKEANVDDKEEMKVDNTKETRVDGKVPEGYWFYHCCYHTLGEDDDNGEDEDKEEEKKERREPLPKAPDLATQRMLNQASKVFVFAEFLGQEPFKRLMSSMYAEYEMAARVVKNTVGMM